MVNFLVKLRPKPQQRHRNNGRFHYDPSSKDKKEFILIAKQEAPPKPTNDMIELDITFCYKRPNNHYRTKNKKKILKHDVPFWKIGRGDLDNLSKTYMDAMNGIFYVDDAQIVSLHARKVYGYEDYIHIKMLPTKKYLEKQV